VLTPEEDTRCTAGQRLIQLQVPVRATLGDQFRQGVAPLLRAWTEPIHEALACGGIEHKVRVKHVPRVTDRRLPPQPRLTGL
jgi:hypothetical protein